MLVRADSLDARVTATLALAGCGLLAIRPPEKSGDGGWECAVEAPSDGAEG